MCVAERERERERERKRLGFTRGLNTFFLDILIKKKEVGNPLSVFG